MNIPAHPSREPTVAPRLAARHDSGYEERRRRQLVHICWCSQHIAAGFCRVDTRVLRWAGCCSGQECVDHSSVCVDEVVQLAGHSVRTKHRARELSLSLMQATPTANACRMVHCAHAISTSSRIWRIVSLHNSVVEWMCNCVHIPDTSSSSFDAGACCVKVHSLPTIHIVLLQERSTWLAQCL